MKNPTGRSETKPEMQVLVIRTSLGEAIAAALQHRIVPETVATVDFSEIERRVLASLITPEEIT